MIYALPVNPRQHDDQLPCARHAIPAASALIWQWLERGALLGDGLPFLHVSCGILLALVKVIHPVWRMIGQCAAHAVCCCSRQLEWAFCSAGHDRNPVTFSASLR